MNILLEKTSDNEWIFIESPKQSQMFEKLDQAEEFMNIGKFNDAMNLLDAIIKQAPELMEAHNDKYLCLCYMDQQAKAYQYLQSTMQDIFAALPEDFLTNSKQHLYWGFLENRPFLRLYFNLASEYVYRSQYEKARVMYEKLLQWNPNDNQGARESVLECYFELGLLDEILTICQHYPEDCMAAVLYAKPLVLFIRKETVAAKKALLEACEILPNVAKELVKNRHVRPKNMQDGYITVGGQDEAYAYWLDFGKYWKRATGAISFVKEQMKTSHEIPA